MKMKKWILLLLIGMLTFTMMGCGNSDDGSETESQALDYSVKLYFASTAFVMEGVDEENGELMPPMESTVSAVPGGQYIAALNALKLPPEDDAYSTVVAENIQFLNAEVDDSGVAYVDISSENLGGGSLTEILFVDQVVYTLTQSFEEVESVQFLIDGKVEESLMGHLETSLPIEAAGNDK